MRAVAGNDRLVRYGRKAQPELQIQLGRPTRVTRLP